MKAELVLDAQATIGESPTWVAEEAALYWVDIKAPALHRLVPDTGTTDRWQLPEDIGAFCLDGAGRALVALRTGLYWLDLGSSALTPAAQAPFNAKLIRFNEGACDSLGRFWVGTMTDPPAGETVDITGQLYSFTTTGGLIPHPDFAFLTNGMAWNREETVFYISHSQERMIYQHKYEREQGLLDAGTEFARFTDTAGIPDGAAMDADGNYWCAAHGGGCLNIYAPDGQLKETVALPVSQPTMCCFGGPELKTLYVTSAREKLGPEQLAQEPYAGGLFRLDPGIAGQPKCWRVA